MKKTSNAQRPTSNAEVRKMKLAILLELHLEIEAWKTSNVEVDGERAIAAIRNLSAAREIIKNTPFATILALQTNPRKSAKSAVKKGGRR